MSQIKYRLENRRLLQMENEFTRIIRRHGEHYPQMMPQDYGKLAYQSEFGPEHMVEDKEQAYFYLRKEWEDMEHTNQPCRKEPVGNGLCRFHLGRTEDMDIAASLLTELFVRTAKEHSGSHEGLLERLEQLRELPVPGMEEWISEYRSINCPAVHHSQPFRDAYHPHYRLLRTEYASYFPVLEAVQKKVRMGTPVIISIDGRCGSGKTGLAEIMHRLFSCNVLHMDDYYLPPDMRKENWEQIPGGNMDFDRFRREVLLPAVRGETIVYRPFDCRTGTFGKAEQILPCALTVVEGSYSGHPMLEAEYDLKIFLTCSKEVQDSRLKAREGGYYHTFEQRWIPMEENYLQLYDIQTNSNMVLDTGTFF